MRRDGLELPADMAMGGQKLSMEPFRGSKEKHWCPGISPPAGSKAGF